MIRSLSKIVLAVALEMLSSGTSASCMPSAVATEKIAISSAVNRSAAVFSGTVTAIEYGDPDGPAKDQNVQLVKVATAAWWKGKRTKEVTLRTGNVRFSDGRMLTLGESFSFEVGKQYLIYAVDTLHGLSTNRCTRTRILSAAATDITSLDALKAE